MGHVKDSGRNTPTQNSQHFLSFHTMSFSSTPSPTIFRDGSDAFGDFICQFDTSKKPEGYWGPSEVGSIGGVETSSSLIEPNIVVKSKVV